MPTKPDGDEPKITKGLALEPKVWAKIDAIAKDKKTSRNRLLEKFILVGLEKEKRKMDSQKIARQVCAEFYVAKKSYPGHLPDDIAQWYVYCSDGGHCIVCCLKSDFTSGNDLTDFLLPIPVKTVMRGYEIKDSYVVVDLPYSEEIGLVVPAEDDEF